MGVPVIDNNNYTIVNKKHFLEPEVYKYNNVYYSNGSRILVSELTGIPGVVLVDNVILNRGPDVKIIQYVYGRDIEMVKIKHVGNFKDIRYSNGEYFIYKHNFKRYKNKKNEKFTINEPKSYKKYNDWKEKSYEKELRKEEKEYRKDEKQMKKEKNKNKDNNDNGNKRNKNYKENTHDFNDTAKGQDDNNKGIKQNKYDIDNKHKNKDKNKKK
jgi:hypothetical protein